MLGTLPQTTRPTSCPYQVGAPIELADLLALPPDGNDYGRDEDGRLVIMSPDDQKKHNNPINRFVAILIREIGPSCVARSEPSVAFAKIRHLRGQLLRESFLGPRAVQPDVAVWGCEPEYVEGPTGLTWYSPKDLLLVVEILSPGTWHSDLGIGEADDVDRKRTYLESGVPEYWILNSAVDDPACSVPLRGALLLSAAPGGQAWEEIPIEGGKLCSRAVPGLALDLESFWRDCRI
ncbi:MAG: Uma2 family endonuclease [Planctomycetes bacterium]|nr:Uma2 family endonuclease [Planctomycetota bacterium]